jgi:hypothetical protein
MQLGKSDRKLFIDDQIRYYEISKTCLRPLFIQLINIFFFATGRGKGPYLLKIIGIELYFDEEGPTTEKITICFSKIVQSFFLTK